MALEMAESGAAMMIPTSLSSRLLICGRCVGKCFCCCCTDVYLQKSAACRDGHRLVLYIDACYSGHWALKARDLSLPKVMVQTSCSSTETSLDGVFTKAFVDFQNSQGTARPSEMQLCSRTPFVYVPWSAESECATAICKDNKGRANRSRPYMHFLSDPINEYCRKRSAASAAGAAAAAAAEAQRRRDAEAAAVAAAEAEQKRAKAAAAAAAEAQRRMAPNQTTVAGIEWAATHDYPNDDLTVTGGAGGWPPRLFGPERSRALAANGITTFSQLMAEVKSRTKEDFYRTFGTCDGKVGVLDTAANTMWEVCMAWDYAYSLRRSPAPFAPVKVLRGGPAVASPAITPLTAQNSGLVKIEGAKSALDALLKQMQIDLQTLHNAAGGKCLSQKGLNKAEIERVLNHFKIDNSGSRQDLNSKLSRLLTALRVYSKRVCICIAVQPTMLLCSDAAFINSKLRQLHFPVCGAAV